MLNPIIRHLSNALQNVAKPVIDYAADQLHAADDALAARAARQARRQPGAYLAHLQAMPGGHHQAEVFGSPPVPVPARPPAPVGATAFARHMNLPRHLHTRHGPACQTLRFRGQELGAMSAYPTSPKAVEKLLIRALRSDNPRIVNLMNRGDMGIETSYVEQFPEKQTVRLGHLQVHRITEGADRLGPNTEGRTMSRVRTGIYVRDDRDPSQKWRRIEHHTVTRWIDTTTPPLPTFERTWRSFYVPGRIDQGVIHCAGGVGRTAMLLFRLSFQSFLDRANAAHRCVSPQEASNFLDDLITEARTLRGNQVMPDMEQIRVLRQSCQMAVQNQRAPQPHPPGFVPWGPMPQHMAMPMPPHRPPRRH